MTKDILNSVLAVADINARRLSEVMTKLQPSIPFDGAAFSALPLEQLSFCDMFVARFSKLQDIMGSKLFGLTLEWAEEGNYETFLDRLNALEKLG